MKSRKENGMMFVSFGYNPDFSEKLKKYCGAKWRADSKEWMFEDEFEETFNDLMLKEYRYSLRSSEKIFVKIDPFDFLHKKDEHTVTLNGWVIASRDRAYQNFKLSDNAVIIKGDIPGPNEYFEKGGCEIRLEMQKEYYDILSKEITDKLTIIRKSDKKESLIARKEVLLKEFEEIEKELVTL